jgi:magnesium-dependent phosphatase 1
MFLFPVLDEGAHDACTGVTFCLAHDGTTSVLLEQGLAEWRRRHLVEVAEDAAAEAE